MENTSQSQPKHRIQTEHGLVVPTITASEHRALVSKLEELYGVTEIQVAETAAFSLAMVVRFALGLSAAEGRICVLVNDSLASAIALAAARHLVNNGSSAVVLLCGDPQQNSEYLSGTSQSRRNLATLEALGVPFQPWESSAQNELVEEVLLECHNTICGLFHYPDTQSAFEQSLISVLNEVSTPVHSVLLPLGVSPDSGARLGEPLFASSTLSLGLPLRAAEAAPDYCGRQYLCDISIPSALLVEELHIELPPLFSEQPVCKLVLQEEASPDNKENR